VATEPTEDDVVAAFHAIDEAVQTYYRLVRAYLVGSARTGRQRELSVRLGRSRETLRRDVRRGE
jgi:hypothetical protein